MTTASERRSVLLTAEEVDDVVAALVVSKVLVGRLDRGATLVLPNTGYTLQLIARAFETLGR